MSVKEIAETKWCEHCQCRHPENWVRRCGPDGVLTLGAKEIAKKWELIHLADFRLSALSVLEHAITEAVAPLEAENAELEKENAHLKRNVSPVDYIRAYQDECKKVEELLDGKGVWAERLKREIKQLQSQIETLRKALEEVVDYRGGADCACADGHVIERIRQALSTTQKPNDSTQRKDGQ